MPISELDSVDRRILSVLQRDFPLVSEPYREISNGLSISDVEVMDRIRRLRECGLVRQISPVIDARRLGYQSTLVASKVPEASIGQAEAVLKSNDGISHAYVRNHEFNIWFTLSLKPDLDANAEVERLGNEMRASSIFSLPVIRLFKIGAFFGAEGDGDSPSNGQQKTLSSMAELSEADKKIINVFQQDLPLARSPFDRMSSEAGMTTDLFLARCRSLKDRGVMRRYGASVNHRTAGFEGNGMACWNVPSQMVESVGRRLSALESVSHCYERRTNELWQYNVFAMFHGATAGACKVEVDGASRDMGLDDYAVLFSTREIKKMRIEYRA